MVEAITEDDILAAIVVIIELYRRIFLFVCIAIAIGSFLPPFLHCKLGEGKEKETRGEKEK